MGDPYAVVTARSDDGQTCFRQQTKVIANCLDPQWNAKFEIPVASNKTSLAEALELATSGLGKAAQHDCLPPQDSVAELEAAALTKWAAQLNNAGGAPAGQSRIITKPSPMDP